MSMDDIRRTYGVPAKKGARVKYIDGHDVIWTGCITSARGMYLCVLLDEPMDGRRRRLILHPKWNVQYL